jgi:hypothetical protein
MANTNEYLVLGWSNQQLGATAGQSGYAQPAPVPAAANVSTAEQAGSNAPAPVIMGGTGASNNPAVDVLTNPGYASGNGTVLGAITAPSVPATTVAVQNPSGLAAIVTITGGTVTAVSTAPWAASAGAASFTTVNPGETSSETQVTVPPGGFIKMTYSAAPTWSWVTTN